MRTRSAIKIIIIVFAAILLYSAAFAETGPGFDSVPITSSDVIDFVLGGYNFNLNSYNDYETKLLCKTQDDIKSISIDGNKVILQLDLTYEHPTWPSTRSAIVEFTIGVDTLTMVYQPDNNWGKKEVTFNYDDNGYLESDHAIGTYSINYSGNRTTNSTRYYTDGRQISETGSESYTYTGINWNTHERSAGRHDRNWNTTFDYDEGLAITSTINFGRYVNDELVGTSVEVKTATYDNERRLTGSGSDSTSIINGKTTTISSTYAYAYNGAYVMGSSVYNSTFGIYISDSVYEETYNTDAQALLTSSSTYTSYENDLIINYSNNSCAYSGIKDDWTPVSRRNENSSYDPSGYYRYSLNGVYRGSTYTLINDPRGDEPSFQDCVSFYGDIEITSPGGSVEIYRVMRNETTITVTPTGPGGETTTFDADAFNNLGDVVDTIIFSKLSEYEKNRFIEEAKRELEYVFLGSTLEPSQELRVKDGNVVVHFEEETIPGVPTKTYEIVLDKNTQVVKGSKETTAGNDRTSELKYEYNPSGSMTYKSRGEIYNDGLFWENSEEETFYSEGQETRVINTNSSGQLADGPGGALVESHDDILDVDLNSEGYPTRCHIEKDDINSIPDVETHLITDSTYSYAVGADGALYVEIDREDLESTIGRSPSAEMPLIRTRSKTSYVGVFPKDLWASDSSMETKIEETFNRVPLTPLREGVTECFADIDGTILTVYLEQSVSLNESDSYSILYYDNDKEDALTYTHKKYETYRSTSYWDNVNGDNSQTTNTYRRSGSVIEIKTNRWIGESLAIEEETNRYYENGKKGFSEAITRDEAGEIDSREIHLYDKEGNEIPLEGWEYPFESCEPTDLCENINSWVKNLPINRQSLDELSLAIGGLSESVWIRAQAVITAEYSTGSFVDYVFEIEYCVYLGVDDYVVSLQVIRDHGTVIDDMGVIFEGDLLDFETVYLEWLEGLTIEGLTITESQWGGEAIWDIDDFILLPAEDFEEGEEGAALIDEESPDPDEADIEVPNAQEVDNTEPIEGSGGSKLKRIDLEAKLAEYSSDTRFSKEEPTTRYLAPWILKKTQID